MPKSEDANGVTETKSGPLNIAYFGRNGLRRALAQAFMAGAESDAEDVHRAAGRYARKEADRRFKK